MKKPINISEYKKWLKEEHGLSKFNSYEQHYESVANKVLRDFETSKFWETLVSNLKEYDAEYELRFGYQLFQTLDTPQLVVKPFSSFLEKTFRKNVSSNKKWPDSPNNGWVLFDDWYSRIGDIVRTSFVIKYLDGVEFFVEKLKKLANEFELTNRKFLEAREEGYYAVHFYVTDKFEIPKVDWDTKKMNISIEIQTTTQLQDVIHKLVHKYYEKKRKEKRESVAKWRWDYRSDEFFANYLGHILHYVEGMIMEVRRRQSEEKK